MKPSLLGLAADTAIRILFCSDLKRFKEIWGNDGAYLWDKFINHFERNEGSFICYLDQSNRELLGREILKEMDKTLQTTQLMGRYDE